MAIPRRGKFRRLSDTLSSGALLTPHLERELVARGEDVWPDEYAIHVYNKEHKFDGYFHPSSHANLPEMELYYMFHPDFQVKQDPPDVQTIMTFQVGSAYHALLQSMLITLGFTTEEEVEVPFVNEEHHCSGMLDIRKLWIPGEDNPLPVEIKSAGFLPKEPPLGYLSQFQVYMDVGCEEPQEQGIMLFLEKASPHRLKEYVIQRDEELLDKIYGRWNRVLEAIEFSDPSMLEFPCHEFDSKAHKECPARYVCRLGPALGERPGFS